jgi:CubicO group peptidase (beta-lactamase class C family)
LVAAVLGKRWADAAAVLAQATAKKQVDAAVLHVVQRREGFTRHFGKAGSGDAMFLLGSISKPITVTAIMTLFDRGRFQLQDRVTKFLPAFRGGGREDVTIRHLLTHVSGLPDQLASNNELRKRHAPLKEFAAQALRARLDFAPGARYQYSSMGILLAARVAERISGTDILTLVERAVFRPLGVGTSRHPRGSPAPGRRLPLIGRGPHLALLREAFAAVQGERRSSATSTGRRGWARARWLSISSTSGASGARPSCWPGGVTSKRPCPTRPWTAWSMR